MDREALIHRNRSMAEAFHATPLRQHIRRVMLSLTSRMPIRPQKPRPAERILLIRPDHLGDTLLTIPAINALRAAQPNAEIHVLVGPWSAGALANLPQVDAVLTLPFPRFDPDEADSYASGVQLIRRARQLRLIGYSSAVILRPDHWWGAVLAFLAGIPQRIGYDTPESRPFLTHVIQHERAHAVRQNLRLVEHWTGPVDPERVPYAFPCDDTDHAYVDAYLKEWDIEPQQPIFCIHPGSKYWVRQWPVENWATVADTLTDQLGATAVFTGSDSELSMVQAITAAMQRPACVIAGDTQVNQLAALFERARVVLGPENGPLHLAAAVDTPTVALFGPSDPDEFHPWGPRDRHLVLTSDIGCRPCRVLDWSGDTPDNHPCLREISIGRVLDAARRVTSH